MGNMVKPLPYGKGFSLALCTDRNKGYTNIPLAPVVAVFTALPV